MHCHPFLRSAVAATLLAVPSFGQNFNIDLGAQQSAPLPGLAYGAGANQPGQWFGVGTTAQTPVALSDINGLATAAAITPTGGNGDFFINNPIWNGNDGLLMEDATDVGGLFQGGLSGSITWTVTGLLPGDYEIYTYALAPDFPGFYNTRVNVVGGSGGPQILTGNWPGSPHVLGQSFSLHTISVVAGQTVTIVTDDPGTVSMNLSTVNGFQFKYTPGAIGTAFCFGDGSGAACPCGNSSAPGSGLGCQNSLALGGRIVAGGSASISNDSVVLTGSGMPNSSALYFQGTSQLAGGLGAAFGDGLRCAGGSIIRLGTKNNMSGTSTYPAGGDLAVSVRGLVTSPGSRTYQCWYRNAAAFCTASTFNLTNGLEIVWAP